MEITLKIWKHFFKNIIEKSLFLPLSAGCFLLCIHFCPGWVLYHPLQILLSGSLSPKLFSWRNKYCCRALSLTNSIGLSKSYLVGDNFKNLKTFFQKYYRKKRRNVKKFRVVWNRILRNVNMQTWLLDDSVPFQFYRTF